MSGHTSPRLLIVASAAVLALAAACTKSETGGTAPGTSATASAAPSASAAASASPTTSASVAAAETASATAAKDGADAGRTLAEHTSDKKDGGSAAATPATSGSAAAAECGTKPLPDCPLQAWMKSNANPPVMTSDTAKLAVALDKIATFAPPGYTNWASISKDGAKAAQGGDLAAAKAACRSCHDQYKQKYKTEMRGRKI